MKIDLKGKGHGELRVDIKTGWILKNDMEQEVSGEIRIAASEQMPEEQKWPIRIVTKVKMAGK